MDKIMIFRRNSMIVIFGDIPVRLFDEQNHGLTPSCFKSFAVGADRGIWGEKKRIDQYTEESSDCLWSTKVGPDGL